MALKSIIVAALLILMLPTYTVVAQESMMNDVSYPFLEKLIVAAKLNYPKMKSFDEKLRQTELKIRFAKLDWFNIFTFAYFPNNQAAVLSPNTSTSYQFGFSTSIGTILQKPTNVKIARQEYKVAEDDRAEYDLNLEAIVKQRYFLYIQQRALLNWRIKDLESNESLMNEMKHKFEKGEETFDNYDKALVTYSNAVQSKISSEGAYLVAKSSLEEIIGAPLESIK